MSANAGRVAIVPKGEWSPEIAYTRLDTVVYKNYLYIARRNTAAGEEPTDDTAWFKSIGAIEEVPLATTEEVGGIKVDGVTTWVDENGVLQIDAGVADYPELTNKPKINNYELNGNVTLTNIGIPQWAQSTNKPSYNASDVGAVPNSRTVNGKSLLSDVEITAKDIKTDTNDSIQKKLDELESFESITYKGTVATYNDLPTNAENGWMYYCQADKKHYVCVNDPVINLYEWHEYHTFDDNYIITVEKVKNDLETQDAGYVLDARQGYEIKQDLNNYEQTTDEEIDGIKSSLTPLDLSNQVTNIKSGLTVKLSKCAGICSITVSGTVTTSVENEVVAKLPSNALPMSNVFFSNNRQADSNWYYINTNGNLIIRNAGTMTNNNFATYIAS